MAFPKKSVFNNFTFTDPSYDLSLDLPVPFFLKKTSAALLKIMDFSLSIIVR